ncbi:mycofactocin biosynthesis glycosyltransferase MftF [Nocardioides sp. J2M5]|uniref:mycofactocin biosynthesis glycosyltransferase MftF n=1 Tax=Nocardioides palaemonis TaxID=2829810 RepID=UPI001BA9C986|nr:mycofactocin biosynthesis glycosyltransferase MftF [Nocardioides palaemonis]MBS2939399.1 mycofactocin biosynthesis glycosyltransferase MftF [Nocardioides palaemonis]
MRPVPEPGDEILPDDHGLVLAPDTHVCDDGRTLMGGSGTVLHLSGSAAAVVARLPLVASDSDATRVLGRRLLDRGLADPWWPDPPVADAEVRDVTLVVPVRDRAAGLARLLAAVPATVPVVVVDDGSLDHAGVAAVAAAHGATLERHRTSRGPAAARNTGLARARTAHVAFCDSDVVPDPGWLGTLRRHLDDPAVALAAPRVLGAASAPTGWLERYEQARSSLDLGPRPASVRVHGRVSYVPSACVVARVAALGDGFDPDLQCGEDVDLVWRLLDAGWRLRYEPAATVRHDHRTRWTEWLGRKAFYGTSAAPLAARHPGAVAPLVLTPWTAALAVSVLAQRRWSLPLGGAACVLATLGTARRLERSERPLRAAAVLTLEGAVATAWQTASALERHYWPLALAAAAVSRRARRAVVVAAVAEGLADRRRVTTDLGPVAYVLVHRADDLAYGAGLWWGAWTGRSVAALVPQLRGHEALVRLLRRPWTRRAAPTRR